MYSNITIITTTTFLWYALWDGSPKYEKSGGLRLIKPFFLHFRNGFYLLDCFLLELLHIIRQLLKCF